MSLAVVIPVYGQERYTKAVLDDLWREEKMRSGEDKTFIVDNLGNWNPYIGETVIKSGANLRWCRGTNLGLQVARQTGFDAYVCVNNDVRLSPGFLGGIAQALGSNPRISVLGPLYDDVWPQQKSDYQDEAGKYKPQSFEQRVNFVDGTCMVITQQTIDAIGILDEENFGEFGWGADIDYCYQTRLAGGEVWVTYRSYLNHIREGTAKNLVIDYKLAAGAELEKGMSKKYGDQWRGLVY